MDDGFLPTSRKHSVIVEVREITTSPSSDALNRHTPLDGHYGIVKGPTDESERLESIGWETISSRSSESIPVKSTETLSTSLSLQHKKIPGKRVPGEENKIFANEHRRAMLQLPSFSTLDIVSCAPREAQQQRAGDEHRPPVQSPNRLQSSDLSSDTAEPRDRPFGVVPPPTPPEDSSAFKWSPVDTTASLAGTQSVPSHQGAPSSQQGRHGTATQAPGNRPPSIPLPSYEDVSHSNRYPATWLDRAVQTIVSSQDDLVRERQLQMVVQALPSQPKSTGAKPVFQQVAEILQQQEADAPYITITHAVSQVISMEEVPASPPATPNNLNTSDDYFDNQTIFTHAAVVPSYHTLVPPSVQASSRANGIITAPASTHVSTLERYIPPTTAQEVQDFFSISRRSYLVDRLTELSPRNGTLLFVYPTATGSTTFARSYIGPVIDPFLRQFCLLNNLTIDAAARLGKTAALPAMMDFETMAAFLGRLCLNLTKRAPAGREPRSGYDVIHAEPVSIILERATWIEWFVEQETARLRQDMIDYQKAGGRMPARGFDATPGSMVREVIEGIKNSTETAGGVGIEVGVFVVRRSML